MSENIMEGITLSSQAADKVRSALKIEGKDGYNLRMSVKGGGCSGMTYKVDYAEKIKDNDEVVDKEGIKFIIDPSASLFLLGCTIDWKEEKFKNGFSFENPNEVARCGCGESFSV